MRHDSGRILAATAVCSFLATALPARGAPVQVNGLGTNYVAFDFGAYNPSFPWLQDPASPNNNNWYQPGHNVKTPVGLYHLNPGLVNAQLGNMRASGIDTLVLFLPASELATCESNGACPNGFNDGTWGLLVDNSRAALDAQKQQNLIAILTRAKALGFRKVFLRFATGEPSAWASWDETAYQRIWNFICNTRAIASSVLANSATRLLVDLAAEIIGEPNGQNQQFVQRLWSDYTYTFGTADTIGFSFVAYVPYVQAGLTWLTQTAAPMPNSFAFDVYGDQENGVDVGSALLAAWNALGTQKTKPIMIMETHSNERITAIELSRMLAANPALNLTDLVQWPVTRSTACCDLNLGLQPIAALASQVQVSNYSALAKATVIENLTPSLLSFADVNCALHDSVCTVQAQMGFQPVGAKVNWQVYVRRNDQPRALWGCNSGQSTSQANWIDPGSTWLFEYYKTQSCSDTPTGAPDAASYLTFHACQNGSGQTVDLRSDADHCGACNLSCPAGPVHGTRSCSNGFCGYVCQAGYVDCDGLCKSPASCVAH